MSSFFTKAESSNKRKEQHGNDHDSTLPNKTTKLRSEEDTPTSIINRAVQATVTEMNKSVAALLTEQHNEMRNLLQEVLQLQREQGELQQQQQLPPAIPPRHNPILLSGLDENVRNIIAHRPNTPWIHAQPPQSKVHKPTVFKARFKAILMQSIQQLPPPAVMNHLETILEYQITPSIGQAIDRHVNGSIDRSSIDHPRLMESGKQVCPLPRLLTSTRVTPENKYSP